MSTKVVTIRVPDDMFRKLPKASLRGTRTQYILDAIRDRLVREGRMGGNGHAAVAPSTRPKTRTVTRQDEDLLA